MTEIQRIIARAIKIARQHAAERRGEEGGNNIGPDIFEYRRTDGTGKRVTGKGSWCGSSASSQLRQSAKELLVTTPFETSRGARRLVKNAAAVGSFSAGPETRLPHTVLHSGGVGGLIAWKRVGWRGHVEWWYDYCCATDTLYCVGGNHRKKGERLAYMNEFIYPNGSWRKRMDRIVAF